MNFSILDDETLIRLIIHRQTEALSELYNRYSRLVYSMAFNTVGDPAVAEEITQDVFLRVWEKASTYQKEQAKVSTWVSSITRYRAIDVLRHQSSRPERNSIGWGELSPGLEPTSDSPEGQAEALLEHQRVRAAIASLPPDQQTALALAYFHGLSHSQIAQKLDEPLGTVKTRIRLAMQKLREVLQDDLRVRP